MGDSKATSFRPGFNGSLRVEGRGERLTSHAGVVLLRELDDKLGLTASLAGALRDPRDPRRVRHSQSELLRSWLYSMATDRTHASALDVIRDDAAFRLASSDRRGLSMIDGEQGLLASQPTRSRLLAGLAVESNLRTLEAGLFDSAARAVFAMHKGKRLESVTLDIDSFPQEVHGHQPGSEHNGYYRMNCYHPLGVMLGETGHWIALKLRPGNVHTAEGAQDVLLPLVARAEKEIAERVRVRGDAGFVGPDLLGPLDAGGVKYAFRLRSNAKLDMYEEFFARRPVGRPPAKPRTWCHDIEYQAESWTEKKRVVLVVQERPGELYLHTFFILTSFTPEEMHADDVLDFYRARGTMEGHIGEHQSVLRGALSSTNRPKKHIKRQPIGERAAPIDAMQANAAALCLHGIAYNLLNTLRLVGGEKGSADEPAGLHLGRARARFVALAGRVVVSARRATLIVAANTTAAWSRLWSGIMGLAPQPPPA